MKTLPAFLYFVTTIFVFTSCTSTKPVVTEKAPAFQQVTKNNTAILFIKSEPSKRQTILKIDSSGNIKILTAPASEQAYAKDSLLHSNIKVKGEIEAETLLKAKTELHKLNNKSLALSSTKEALYRLSEAYFNGLIDSSRYVQMYQLVMTQSSELLSEEIELEEAKAETIIAETERAKVELQKAQLEFERYKFEKGIVDEKKSEPKEVAEEKTKEEKEKED